MNQIGEEKKSAYSNRTINYVEVLAEHPSYANVNGSFGRLSSTSSPALYNRVF